LAKNYITDTKVTKELIEEGYNRSLKEVHAAHILLNLEENAVPVDTLKIYNQMLDIRKKALGGEDFSKLAKQFSQDPSAKENNGDLGYFSAFRMVYPFESAAFKTKKGDISMPVRTRYGYHILKVLDIRDNRGEINVAHIMIAKQTEPKLEEKAKNTIDDIYKKLQQGEKFETLAQQFSEDKSSAEKGGVLNRFASGQLSSNQFEDIAFSLSNENPLSAPFQTEFGWHIVKFIERFPTKTFDEMQSDLDTKIRRDDRSRLITNSMNDKLRKEYPIKRDDKLYAAISKTVNKDYLAGTWKAPVEIIAFDKNLFTIKDKPVTGVDFLAYLEKQQKGLKDVKVSLSQIVDKIYEQFVDDQLNTYYDNNLENKFPEFKDVMEEYRDGLLLFDLMEKEIWEKSKNDTIGLENFYKSHKFNYQWKNRVDALITSSTKEDVIKKAQKMLKNNATSEAIKEKLNVDKKVEIMENQGVFEEGNEVLPKNVKFVVGVSDVEKKGDYFFVTRVNKVLPASEKSLEDCKGKVINDYQQYLEENWVSDLKKEFTINVNSAVFEKVKKEIKI
jgi:peptidyl-prolyl cis-trans isomerase SurA